MRSYNGPLCGKVVIGMVAFMMTAALSATTSYRYHRSFPAPEIPMLTAQSSPDTVPDETPPEAQTITSATGQWNGENKETQAVDAAARLLFKRINSRSLSPLELQYGNKWLQAALGNPEARKAFEQWLGGMQEDQPALLLAMRAYSQAAPEAFSDFLKDSIRQNQQSFIISGLQALANANLPSSTKLDLSREVLALKDQRLWAYAPPALLASVEADTQEEVVDLLERMIAIPSSDGEVASQSQAWRALVDNAMLTHDTGRESFEALAMNGEWPTERLIGTIYSIYAAAVPIRMNQLEGAESVVYAADVAVFMLEMGLRQMEREDAVTRYYLALELDDSVSIASDLWRFIQ